MTSPTDDANHKGPGAQAGGLLAPDWRLPRTIPEQINEPALRSDNIDMGQQLHGNADYKRKDAALRLLKAIRPAAAPRQSLVARPLLGVVVGEARVVQFVAQLHWSKAPAREPPRCIRDSGPPRAAGLETCPLDPTRPDRRPIARSAQPQRVFVWLGIKTDQCDNSSERSAGWAPTGREPSCEIMVITGRRPLAPAGPQCCCCIKALVARPASQRGGPAPSSKVDKSMLAHWTSAAGESQPDH